MSTRAVIARPTGNGFTGRYHHWDGYPQGLGATLFRQRRDTFAGDTDAMLRYLLDEHPGGWSTINGKDLTRPAGFCEGIGGHGLPCVTCGQTGDAHLCQHAHPHTPPCVEGDYSQHLGHRHEPDPTALAEMDAMPQCYCHGDRHESDQGVTDMNAGAIGCEWAYVLGGQTMLVLSARNGDGSKMVGAFGMGNPESDWITVAVVDLDGPEPGWDAIAEKG